MDHGAYLTKACKTVKIYLKCSENLTLISFYMAILLLKTLPTLSNLVIIHILFLIYCYYLITHTFQYIFFLTMALKTNCKKMLRLLAGL